MIPESALPGFRTSLRGQLLFPGEPAYEEARKIHNALIDRHPAMIVRCAGVADVMAAVWDYPDVARRSFRHRYDPTGAPP